MARKPVDPINPLGPSPTLAEIVAAVQTLQNDWITREPLETGDPLDKFLTLRQAVDSGVVIYLGRGAPGTGGKFEPPPGGGLGGYDDLTPADPLTGLVVTSVPVGFIIEFTSPTYRQGGGNALSIIFRAPWDGVVGHLPVFAAAIEVARTTERQGIFTYLAEPGTYSRFWVQPMTHAEEFNQLPPQTPPTGGLHGVGDDPAGMVSSDHIVDLVADKIRANTIAVSVGLMSDGYDPGVYGFYLHANGDAEFNNGSFRGTIYAEAGLIGGAIIDADGVESDNYVAGTAGWRLDNTTGTVKAYAGEFGGSLKAATGTLGALVIASGGSIRQGMTGYLTGSEGLFMGASGGVTKVAFGDPTGPYMAWDPTNGLRLNEIEFVDSFTASLDTGDITWNQGSDGNPIQTVTATPSGGRAPYFYLWQYVYAGFHQDPTFGIAGQVVITGGITNSTITVDASSIIAQTINGRLVCMVRDSNGRTTFASCAIFATFDGSDAPGGDVGD